MSGKQMEGDADQKRAAAKQARAEGRSPSEAHVTTGGSEQREHLSHGEDHEDKLTTRDEGKQQPHRS